LSVASVHSIYVHIYIIILLSDARGSSQRRVNSTKPTAAGRYGRAYGCTCTCWQTVPKVRNGGKEGSKVICNFYLINKITTKTSNRACASADHVTFWYDKVFIINWWHNRTFDGNKRIWNICKFYTIKFSSVQLNRLYK
jgi:hypothetical protein